LLCRVLGFHATFPSGPAFFFGPQRGARREGLVALSAWCRLCLKRPGFCSKCPLRAPRFCNPFLGEPAPSVEVTGPRSLTAWRPSTCTKRESSAHSAFFARRQPTGARLRIVLVPKASGKPLRPRDLARGTRFGTMRRNRAAHLYLRRSSRHKQSPGPLNPLFSSVLRTGYIQAEGEGFEPSWANAHPPPRPPLIRAGAKL